jgi:ABC-2 type transport system ATP-binding protein
MSQIDPRQPVIAIDRLTKFYGSVRGIEDVTLDILPGEVFGFLGPNGAGKSTCIRSMLGLIKPTSGRVTLLGRGGETVREARQSIGYLPEIVSFYDELTVGAMLDFIGRFFRQDTRAARRRSELLARFAVDPDVKIRNCSKGTVRKVGIVQAFMHEPELLVLDEPTSGLDPLMQEEFYRLVEEESGRGRTVFLSSHNLTEAERISA